MKLASLAVLSVMISAACNAGDGIGPPLGLAHSTASRACGPTDGPAVAVYLTPTPTTTIHPPPPYVRILVWQPVSEISGRWDVSADSPDGFAAYVDSPARFQPASSGTIRFGTVAADTTLVGTVDLVFTSTRRVRGSFRAVWIPSQPGALCG